MDKSVIDVLEELECTSGTNAKRDILLRNAKNNLLKEAFVAAQDPYTVYYVSKLKLPPSVKDIGLQDDEAMASFLDEVLPTLSSRKVTGNAAKDYVTKALSAYDSRQQKWAMRILLRNLRIGVQETTVNKVWPGAVKSFCVSLAETLRTGHKGGIKILDPVSWPKHVEPKLDGLRCVAIKQAGSVRFYTRNGTLLETLPTIAKAIEESPVDNFVLDGEALGEDWNESASILMSKKHKKDDSNIMFHVFDAMPLDSWVSQLCTNTLLERLQYVATVLGTLPPGSPVKQVKGQMISSEQDLLSYYASIMNEGYEGVMLKDPGAPYHFKRSDAILKMKPYTTYEGVIVGHYEGRTGTKNEGLFGGFHVVLPNGIITRVGSGFNDAMRADIQLNGPESYVGMIAELEGQPDPLTQDGLTKDGKIRFPVFCRIRNAADVDKSVVTAGERLLG